MIFLNSFWYSSPPVPPPGGDPNFANVSLLLHMNGTNGGTSFVDSSSSAKTITAFGNAQTSTAQSKFNGSSGLFDGNGDEVYTATGLTDLDFGTGDWTIECFARWASISNYQTIYDRGYTDANGLLIQTGNGTGTWIVYTSGSSRVTETSSSPSTGVWYHYAIVQSGTTITIYRDGVAAGSGSNTVSLSSASASSIGAKYTNASFGFAGNLAEFRITKGVARYTSDFTPPSAAFPDA
jgi:hypothetical protein